jgi:hypothetical protein
MYRFSRSIYRELSPRVEDCDEVAVASAARQHLLEASEATVRRMAEDRCFARPARTLFSEVREHFALAEQVRVYMVIERYLDLAAEFLERLPEDVRLGGQPRHCQASTRKGTPCQREPLPGRDYCPSHKHLEESLETLEERVGAAA